MKRGAETESGAIVGLLATSEGSKPAVTDVGSWDELMAAFISVPSTPKQETTALQPPDTTRDALDLSKEPVKQTTCPVECSTAAVIQAVKPCNRGSETVASDFWRGSRASSLTYASDALFVLEELHASNGPQSLEENNGPKKPRIKLKARPASSDVLVREATLHLPHHSRGFGSS